MKTDVNAYYSQGLSYIVFKRNFKPSITHISPENNNVTSAVDINNYICRRVWTGIFMIDAHIHISNEIKSEKI